MMSLKTIGNFSSLITIMYHKVAEGIILKEQLFGTAPRNYVQG